ncbi:MAG: potassium channel protein [Candidatus Eisenbacteria bacterium]|nr:potassium channel protein [Candidatus Eisenbacteria bacterium]
MRTFYLAIALLIGVLVFGTLGYMLIESLPVLDAVYMTVITIATVGFQEIKEGGLSPAGRVFTIFVIFLAIGVGTYGIGSIFAFIVEGRLRHAIRRKRMRKEIENLADHYVIAGIGKTGWEVVAELERIGEPYVVIDIDDAKIGRLNAAFPKALAIVGNATEESALEEAGIRNARAMICALPDDAENIVAVLTARGLKLDLLVISRGVDEESIRKLRRAGADQVILPAQIAGIRMASFAVRPHICDFLDFVTRGKDVTLRMEEVVLARDAVLAGKALRDSRIREESGAIVIGVRHKENMIINPPVDLVLGAGDTLILLGTEDQLANLYRYMKVER